MKHWRVVVGAIALTITIIGAFWLDRDYEKRRDATIYQRGVSDGLKHCR